jgi:hypothetical protein
MTHTLVPIDTSFTVVNSQITSIRRGLLLVKDCFGYIMYHAVLREPKSEVNVSHIRLGIYHIELIVGQTSEVQSVLIR